jgi:hypothetical protein
MIGGWLIGLSMFGLSYLRAQWVVHAASQRAQGIWSKPEEVNPATLPEEDRLALLALIEARQRPQRKSGPPVKLSPEEIKQFKPVSEPRADLVRQFLRVSKDRAVAEEFENGDWGWLVLSNSDTSPAYDPKKWERVWSDEPGDDWWFVDPATGERTDRTLSDVEAEMEWPEISVALALLFSAPWLWYFLLARLREISDAVRAHTRD